MKSRPSGLNFNIYCFAFLLLILFQASSNPVSAQTMSFRNRIMDSTIQAYTLKNPLSSNVLTVANDARTQMLNNTGQFNDKVKYKTNLTYVKLAVNHDSVFAQQTPYVYKIMYELRGSSSRTGTTESVVANDSITIAYSPDSIASFQDVQMKVYPDLFSATLKVVQVYDITNGNLVPINDPAFLQKNFSLSLGMQYQPFLKTHYQPSEMNLVPSTVYNSQNRTLKVSWAPTTTPVLARVMPAQYELEWTYVDDYSATGGKIPAYALHYDFTNNATRILTDSMDYTIPVVYPTGYLVYRVRMIRVDSNQYRYPIYGNWSLGANSGQVSAASNFPITSAHMGDTVNWNYNMQFAEGGKYKHVLSYSDGMLKNRQTITRFNSNPNQLLVTENIYDYEGRSAIQTLPAVVDSLPFQFVPKVSISSITQKPYAASDFDPKPTLCPDEINIPAFSDSSYANQYYSPLNKGLKTADSSIAKFIPKAEGYPFVQKQLSAGFSDRVERAGGAGPLLQVGKGHDTKYEYANADQADLNQLFGVNAGFQNFYNKTVVTDPNGQQSMVIKDYEGKQVATSLIGAAINPNTEALMFNEEVPADSKFREDKLANANQLLVGHEKKYNGNFYMDVNSFVNMRYEYNFQPYQVCAYPFVGLSVKGRYDFKVTDACGIQQFHKGGELGTTGVVTSPSVPSATADTSRTLEKGMYTVDKTLTIATDDIYAAVDSYFAYQQNCALTEDSLIKKEVVNASFPCYNSVIDPCTALENKMMEELFAGAKYGKYTRTTDGTVYGLGPSIFDITKNGPRSDYRYKLGCDSTALNNLSIVKFGHTYTNILRLPVDTFLMIYTGPERYTIAKQLLPLHPEYCRLQSCFADDFETELKAIPDATTAQKYGWFTLDTMVYKDGVLRQRMINAPIGMATIADSLKLMYGGRARMDTLAAELAFCLNDDTLVYGDAKKYFHNDIVNRNFSNVSTQVKNTYFDRLRALYLANREKYKSIAQTGGGNACQPCADLRMALVNPPLVTVTYNTNGSFNTTSPGGLLGLFSGSMQSSLASVLNAGNTPITDTGTIRQYQDSATTQVRTKDSILNYVAVDSIMGRMINCVASSTAQLNLRAALISMIDQGQVHNGVFLPEQIRAALGQANIPLSDLCHPYLLNYDFYEDAGGTRGTCASASFYEAARQFFNSPEINGVLRSVSAVNMISSPGWPAPNTFADLISAKLPGSGGISIQSRYDYTSKTVRLAFYRNGPDTVLLSMRSPVEVPVNGIATPFFNTTGSLVFDNISCFYEDPQAYAEGHIGRFLFRASASRTDANSNQTYTAGLLGWNNGTVPMNDAGGNNPIASCVPCTQFKTVYKAFADSLQLYGGYAADHPLFYKAMRNFMNYTLKKVFGEDQYQTFLQSCALADSMRIPMYGGAGRFENASPATVSSFIQGVQQSYGFTPKVLVDYTAGGSRNVIFNYGSVPYERLRLFNQYLQGTPGGVVNATASSTGRLLLPASLPGSITPSDILNGANGYTVGSPSAVTLMRGQSQAAYQLYTVQAPGTATYQDLSVGASRIQQNLYDDGVQGYWLPTNLATVNQDYYLPEKQQLLAYTYGMQGLSPAKVLDTLQDYLLKSRIPAFSGTEPSYKNPSNPDRVTDLYFSNSSNHLDGYNKLEYVLQRAKTTFGSTGKIFPGGYAYYPLQCAPYENLNVYECGDGLYWYRYFDSQRKLYNIYVRFPAHIKAVTRRDYQLVGKSIGTGDTTARTFNLALYNPAFPGDTVIAIGTTDFDLAWSRKLSDVLLGNTSNYNTTPPLSGQPGASLNCEQQRLVNAINTGKNNYRHYIDSAKTALKGAFYAHVMGQLREKLWIEYVDMRFATTLYSYDLAGNLVMTVPPTGVQKLSPTVAATVDNFRLAGTANSTVIPAHQKTTRYEYNTINKPVKETTPDAGIKTMSYNAKGNVVLSQTARQHNAGLFTYVIYDKQDRIIETGEVPWGGCPVLADKALYRDSLGYKVKTAAPNSCYYEDHTDSMWRYGVPGTDVWVSDTSFRDNIYTQTRRQVVVTIYDSAFLNLAAQRGMSAQENLRSRIAANLYYDVCSPGIPKTSGYVHATHYSYDMEGNVKTLTQDFPELAGVKQQFKRVDYEYDLLSGKVNMIAYNRGFADQLYQRYEYDDDNRIKKALTSRDGLIWKRDAEYSYYKHGPLARTSLGDQRVQGIDYAYTLQGWLKAINGDRNDTAADMGRDGTSLKIEPRDNYATVIDYFEGDYKPIGKTALTTMAPGKNLYNGNIARQTTDVASFGALTTAYTYDQMNRLRQADYAKRISDVLTFNTAYASAYKYDLDGNLKMLTRRDNSGNLMDTLVYAYPNATRNNQLTNVLDYAPNSTHPDVEDLKQYTNASSTRMLYDDDGNLVKDLTSATDSVQWNVYGKATQVTNKGQNSQLVFKYDGAGQRVSKEQTFSSDTGRLINATYYVRDATGNILTEYTSTKRYGRMRMEALNATLREAIPTDDRNNIWINGLHDMGYLQADPFASYMISLGGDQGTGGGGGTTTPAEPSHTAGYYLSHDAALSQKFFVNDDAAVRAMCAYSADQGQYPAGDVLAMATKYGSSDQIEILTNAAFYTPKEQEDYQQSLTQLFDAMPQIYHDVTDLYKLDASDDGQKQQLLNLLWDDRDNASGMLREKLYSAGKDAPESLTPWLQQVGADARYLDDGKYSDNLRKQIEVYGDKVADKASGGDESLKESLGIYGFANWWSGSMDRITQLGGGDPGDGGDSGGDQSAGGNTAAIEYYNDPVGYVTSVVQNKGIEVTDTALAKVSNVDYQALAMRINVSLPDIGHPEQLAQMLQYQDIGLAAHHLYGSSRLGLSAYWPGQYANYWDYSNGSNDTTLLAMPRPWYSYSYNQFINPGVTSEFGNGLNTAASMQHIIGQKQYELASQLGNVQATVSDKRYLKLNADKSLNFGSAVVAAYDYYPFGMLMPGRVVNDTARHEMWVTRTVMTPRVITEYLTPVLTPRNGGIIDLSGDVVIVRSGETGRGGADLPVVALADVGNELHVAIRESGSQQTWRLSVLEKLGDKEQELWAQIIGKAGDYKVGFTPSVTDVVMRFDPVEAYPGGTLVMERPKQTRTVYEPQETLVKIYSKSNDKYEFGFNGQMKMNEIAGMGNWNTALYWEYNTRTGIRANRDQEFAKKPNQSPYATNSGNPIWFYDPLGNLESTHTDEQGNVVAVVNDGDKGIYKHGNNADGSAPTQYQIEKRQKKLGTSAGGEKMGETLTPLGFADFKAYEDNGTIRPGENAHIDFGSTWATERVNAILKANPSAGIYAWNARGGEKWDIKTKAPGGVYYGSLLYGKYASARDAGNFAAGAVGQMSMLSNNLIHYGFGTYNNSGNNVKASIVNILGDALFYCLPDTHGEGQYNINNTIKNYEDKLSKMGIEAGESYIKLHHK